MRKRTWAAALALWLLVAYPLTTGPMQYAALRDWVSVEVYYVYCWVPMRGLNNELGVRLGYWDWIEWWGALADRHAGSD